MTFRIDIQALRGFAVLAVVMQHADAGWLQAGYLGVDIFFVVSGFLITGMIRDGIARGGFRFSEFYFRRAKRLLPAAYVTFLATAVLSVALLDASEWNDFAAQLAGAVTFTCNFVLWQQTGYFEGAAALKPLLHVWSLSLEEQYYLLLPATLVWLPRRYWLPGMAVVLVASLALYLALMRTAPDAAFYLLPARAWELALGSLAVLVRRDSPALRTVARWLFWPMLVLLVAIPILPLGLSRAVSTVAVCVATTIVIWRQHQRVADNPVTRALAWVGDFSYSLYLVHWPIFAFINNVHAGDPSLGEPSAVLLGGAVALALVLGYALFRVVELPVRRARFVFSRRWLVAALGVSLALALAPISIAARAPDPERAGRIDYAHIRRDNVGFGDACEFYRSFEPIAACRNAAAPAMMVWGDSFAMHLVTGIAASTDAGVLQATKSSCAPFDNLAQMTAAYPRAMAENCLSYNRAVLEYLAATPSIDTVVMSSAVYPYFDHERELLQLVDGQVVAREPGETVALEAMRRTITTIRAMGKRVVIVAPPPSTGFDYTHCLERRARGRTILGTFTTCNMPVAEYHASKAGVRAFLQRVEQETGVAVVSFDDALCTKVECRTELDGTFLYRDEGHFSYDGSRALGVRMKLGSMLERAAR